MDWFVALLVAQLSMGVVPSPLHFQSKKQLSLIAKKTPMKSRDGSLAKFSGADVLVDRDPSSQLIPQFDMRRHSESFLHDI
jgi:hypothetical protein